MNHFLFIHLYLMPHQRKDIEISVKGSKCDFSPVQKQKIIVLQFVPQIEHNNKFEHPEMCFWIINELIQIITVLIFQ